MKDDYYDEGGGSDKAMPEGSDNEKDNTDSTALLPKSFFQGKELEPGKQCKVEIVKLYEDEAEVKYVPHDDKESKAEEDSESPMAMASESEDENYS